MCVRLAQLSQLHTQIQSGQWWLQAQPVWPGYPVHDASSTTRRRPSSKTTCQVGRVSLCRASTQTGWELWSPFGTDNVNHQKCVPPQTETSWPQLIVYSLTLLQFRKFQRRDVAAKPGLNESRLFNMEPGGTRLDLTKTDWSWIYFKIKK